MRDNGAEILPTDLVDGVLTGPESESWLAAHPEAVGEVEIARRVRALMAELRALEIEMPVDFEVRLMERVRGDEAMLNLLDLWLSGFGRALLELLEAVFAMLPQPTLAPA
jgi:hypothetical protein